MKTVTTGRTYRVVPIETGAIAVGARVDFTIKRPQHSVPALSFHCRHPTPGWLVAYFAIALTP